MVSNWSDFYDLDVSNRRCATRVRTDLDLQYCTENGDSGDCVAINLSRTGARIVTRNPAMARGEFTLKIGRSVQVLAKTVWQSEGPGGHTWVAGVHFTSVSYTQEKELDGLMAQLCA